MALNSMYPDGWFALGAAALKVTCHANYRAYKLGSSIILFSQRSWKILEVLF